MRQTVEPGWKQDPNDPSIVRWWDGQSWTTQTQPAVGPNRAAAPGVAVDSGQPPTIDYPGQPPQPQVVVNQIVGTTAGNRTDVPAFHFNGGAATYVGTGILAFAITVVTVGIMYPYALVMLESWKAKHTFIEGRRLMFTGTGMGLFGNWIKWLCLCFITFGIYSFWVRPRLIKWKTEHLAFDPTR